MKKNIKMCSLGAASLVAGSILALSAGAPAGAVSDTLNYSCAVPVLGAQAFTAVLDTDAPETMEVGETAPISPMTSTVTVPESLSSILYGVGARTVTGSASVTSFVNGVEVVEELTFPSTPVTETGDLTVLATGPGTDLAPTEEGDLVITAGNFETTLTAFDEDGEEIDLISGFMPISCTIAGDQDPTVDTVAVTAAVDPDPVEPDPVEPDAPSDENDNAGDNSDTDNGSAQVPLVVPSGL